MNHTTPRFRTVLRFFLGALTQPLFRYLLQASAAAQASPAASTRCCKQVLLQASEPPQANAAAACGSCCGKRAHPPQRAPVIYAAPAPFRAGRTTKKEEGRSSRWGVVAYTASVEKRKLDRTSACWCLLLLTASAACCCAAGRYYCLHDFCSACWVLRKCCRCCKCLFFRHNLISDYAHVGTLSTLTIFQTEILDTQKCYAQTLHFFL